MPELEKDKIYTDIVKLNKTGKYGGADPDKPSSITEVMKIITVPNNGMVTA